MSNTRALIFANGQIPDIQIARSLVQPGDILIAADGGTHHILSMGLPPSVIIGDLDSFSASSLDNLEPTPEIIRYPGNKEETDLELALGYALEREYAPIIIIAALGGRLDQTIGNLSILTSPVLIGRDIRLDDGLDEAFYTHGLAEWRGTAGDIVSLIPWGVPVQGVRTNGLRWSLRDETLYPHKTRGISNEMSGTTASVQIKSGLLLIIHSRSLKN
jgi:thiamine pyrophosphokinase